MSLKEARRILALYLSGSDLARHWDQSGLKPAELDQARRDLEDVLCGRFDVVFGDNGVGRRLFKDRFNGKPIGEGGPEDLLFCLRDRKRGTWLHCKQRPSHGQLDTCYCGRRL